MLRRLFFPATIPAVALFAQFFGPAAGAATVNYDEAVSGDLVYGGRTDIPVLFAFDTGVNTVTGTVTNSSPTSGNPPPRIFDDDGFQFSLGAGLQLDSVSVIFSFNPTPNSELAPGTCTAFILYTTGPRALFAYNKAAINYANPCEVGVPEVASGGQLWAPVLPLANGVWEVQPLMGSITYGGGTLDYGFAFNVSGAEVPLPGTLGLFGLAFAGIGAFVRRGHRG